MGAAGLDHLIELGGPTVDRFAQVHQCRAQFASHLQRRRQVQGCRNHVVARLSHVDVIIGADIDTFGGSQVSDHLVDVHVARGPGAGLEDIHRKLIVMPSVDHRLGRLDDGLGTRPIEQPQVMVDPGRSTLDMRDGMDEAAGMDCPETGKLFTAR